VKPVSENKYETPKSKLEDIEISESEICAEQIVHRRGEPYAQISNFAVLPCVCIECGKKDLLNKKVSEFRYVKPISYLLIIIGLIIPILLPITLLLFFVKYFLKSETVVVEYFRCSTCEKRRQRFITLSYSMWALFAISIVARANLDGRIYALPLFVTLILAIAFTAMKGPSLKLAWRKNENKYLLKGINFIGL
jgi:hypothetical protein